MDFPTLLAQPALAELREYCTFVDDGQRWLSGRVLADPDALERELVRAAELDRQAGRRPVSCAAALSTRRRNLHTRAYASEWSIYLAGTLLYLVTVPALLVQAVPDVSLDSLSFEPDGYPKRLLLAPTLQPAPDLAARYGVLLDEVFPTMVESLHRASGLSRDILWVNVATRIDSVFLTLVEHMPSMAEVILAEREQLLGAARTLDGLAPNPYRAAFIEHHSVHPLAPDPLQVRRNCCLRYAFDDHFKYCTTCPLLKKLPFAERQAHFEHLAEHAHDDDDDDDDDHDHDHDHDFQDHHHDH